MIYLHTDKRYRRDQWYRRFEFLLAQNGFHYKKINLLRKDFKKLWPDAQDALIGRFGHSAKDLRRIGPIYGELADMFKGRVFPKKHTYYYYDDKRRQLDLLRTQNYPIPKSAFLQSRDDIERSLDEAGLDFPLVTKRSYGASSAQVRLARNAEELYVPGIVQEYCSNNDRDMRIVVIGDRAMGFFRRNRPNDFRASGSGLLEYGCELDYECVQMVHEISRRNGFESMAYDLIRDNHGRWVVLEFSYCYVDTCVRDCGYYHQMPGGERKGKMGIYPQDYIIEDFLNEHPELRAPAKRNSLVRAA